MYLNFSPQAVKVASVMRANVERVLERDEQLMDIHAATTVVLSKLTSSS